MTNQTNLGSPESETGVFAERWDEISKMIDGYLSRIKAKAKSADSVVETILGMSYVELCKLGHEQCGEYSFMLAQYSYFLQQEINFHKSKVIWCDNTIMYMTCHHGDPHVMKNTYIKTPEKAAILAGHDRSVKSLLEMSVYAKIICENLESLSMRIDTIVRTLTNLQQSKRANK